MGGPCCEAIHRGTYAHECWTPLCRRLGLLCGPEVQQARPLALTPSSPSLWGYALFPVHWPSGG